MINRRNSPQGIKDGIPDLEDLYKIKANYQELLYAVSTKVAGESRHDTALRYIRAAENQCNGPEASGNIRI